MSDNNQEDDGYEVLLVSLPPTYHRICYLSILKICHLPFCNYHTVVIQEISITINLCYHQVCSPLLFHFPLKKGERYSIRNALFVDWRAATLGRKSRFVIVSTHIGHDAPDTMFPGRVDNSYSDWYAFFRIIFTLFCCCFFFLFFAHTCYFLFIFCHNWLSKNNRRWTTGCLQEATIANDRISSLSWKRCGSIIGEKKKNSRTRVQLYLIAFRGQVDCVWRLRKRPVRSGHVRAEDLQIANILQILSCPSTVS